MDHATVEIRTKPTTTDEMVAQFRAFISQASEQGSDLRMEDRCNLTGRRLVFVFSWDDMG